jgi:hypothetical protein
MRELHTVLEALSQALADGILELELCEVERPPLRNSKQQPLSGFATFSKKKLESAQQ